jgi:hypothetical protein
VTKDKSKFSHALLNYYIKLYENKYGRKPIVNIYKEKWAMADVVESIGYDRAKELLDYYFTVTNPSHQLTWFFYNFDRLDDMLNKTEQDKERRAKIRAASKTMVEGAE